MFSQRGDGRAGGLKRRVAVAAGTSEGGTHLLLDGRRARCFSPLLTWHIINLFILFQTGWGKNPISLVSVAIFSDYWKD